MKKLIADEVVTAIPFDNLFGFIAHFVDGFGYSASIITRGNPLEIAIALFEGNKLEDGTITLIEAGAIVARQLRAADMRIKVYCETERQGQGFSPCERAAEIMCYLLRTIEGDEAAEAWRPPWEIDNNPRQAAEVKPIAPPAADSPERAAGKDTVYRLIMDGNNLKQVEAKSTIPYGTIRMYRDELIAESRLPKEIKQIRKKPNPDSI